MPVTLKVAVDAVDDKIRDYGTGAKLNWARDNTSPIGTFADASGATTLVSGQTMYEIFDSTGAEGHYYRTRIGNSAGTLFSDWSSVFQGGQLTAYATVDALREYLALPDDSRDNVLADLLRRASAWIDAETGRDFYRHPPVMGTEPRTYNIASATDVILDDIVSIATVEYATGTGGTYTALASTDWVLFPSYVNGVPYTGVRLSDVGTLSSWSAGYATVRITGVFGFATVPTMIELATLDLARELYQQSVGGRAVGIEFGRLPPSTQAAIERFRHRSYAFA